MSSPQREPAELAALLARKASDDATAVSEFAGSQCRALETDGVELPFPRPRLAELTIFAVPLRYEQLLDAEPLDRQATVALIGEVGEWAAVQLRTSE